MGNDNIDWNGNGDIPYVPAPDGTPPEELETWVYENPAENLSFRVLFDPADRKCAKADPGDPLASLECVCGWCVPHGELPPLSCLDTLGEGEPTCDDGLQ